MMKKSFKFIPFILLVAFSCNKQNRFQQIATQDIPEAQTEIIRMDKEIYQLDQCITKPARTGNYDMLTVNIPKGDSICLSEKIDAIKAKHGERFQLYLYQLGAMTGAQDIHPSTLLYLFLSHPAYSDLYKDCEKEYEDV